MPQDRFEYGSDKSITASVVTKDAVASTGTGSATYTLTGVRGTAAAGATLASGSMTWVAASSSYIGYIAATTWAAEVASTPQLPATMGELIVIVTEGGVPKKIYRDAFFVKGG